MRVLWLVRKNLTEHTGGDTTQILQTAEAVRRQGVEVELASDVPNDLASFDLVHLFHLDRLWENMAHTRVARVAGRPIALSTIFWPADEFDQGGRAGVQGWLARRVGSAVYQDLRLIQRYLLHCREQRRLPWPTARAFGFRRNARELLDATAVLLPNSRIEAEQIEARFGVSRPVVVVPNAADTKLFTPPEAAAVRKGVLCVGRIEPRKNQLALIEALRGTGIPLTLVGQPGRFSRPYFERCQRTAGPDVQFIAGRLPERLREIYQKARVHALVSWYETPGLTSLEAALCGCALVVTPGGCTREYFGEDAEYAQPDDVGSIRAAVERALARPPSRGLAERIAREFNWDQAGARTVEAYELALRAHA